MISILLPIIRPHKAERCLASIRERCGLPETEYEIITDVDHDRIGCPRMVARLLERANGDLICFLGDDTVMEDGCLRYAVEAMKSLPGGWGLVALNDGQARRDSCAHFLMDRRVLDLTGGEIFHVGYYHGYCDAELADVCRHHGRFVRCMEARIRHDHPINGAPTDDDYTRIYTADAVRHDHRMYLERKIAQGRPFFAIGLPIVEPSVSVQFMTSFVTMAKPDSCLLLPRFPVGTFAQSIADARNSLMRQALSEHCTHIIMMDTDQIYPPDTITRLMAHGQPVVGAVIHRRWPPFDPILYRGSPGRYVHVRDEECYSGGLVPVDATGCGCILIDLRCVFDMPFPWFDLGETEDGRLIGEDIGFCARLRAASVPIYVDTSIAIGHITTFNVTREMYELYKKINGFQYRAADSAQ